MCYTMSEHLVVNKHFTNILTIFLHSTQNIHVPCTYIEKNERIWRTRFMIIPDRCRIIIIIIIVLTNIIAFFFNWLQFKFHVRMNKFWNLFGRLRQTMQSTLVNIIVTYSLSRLSLSIIVDNAYKVYLIYVILLWQQRVWYDRRPHKWSDRP